MHGRFRRMERPDLGLQADATVDANAGATTKGVAPVSREGCSRERGAHRMTLLQEPRDHCKPVRSTAIPQAHGQQRPRGRPSGGAPLVQDVVRALRAPLYEPVFAAYAHGCRPQRSGHTALRHIQRPWAGGVWLVDLDIRRCCDRMDPDVLLPLVARHMDDGRFLNLINALLTAGEVEAWGFHRP